MPKIKAGNINLNYDTFGDGEPLLLIMGFGMPGIAWLPSLPIFAGFKCIYFDNRGTGLSDKPDGVYTIEQMADDASNLLTRAQHPEGQGLRRLDGRDDRAGTHPAPSRAGREGRPRMHHGGRPDAKMASPEVAMKLVTGTKLMASNPEQGLDTIMPLLIPPEFGTAHPEIKQMMLAGSEDDAADAARCRRPHHRGHHDA